MKMSDIEVIRIKLCPEQGKRDLRPRAEKEVLALKRKYHLPLKCKESGKWFTDVITVE